MALSYNPARISGQREKQWHEKQTKQSFAKDRADIRRRLRKHLIRGSKLTKYDLKEIDDMLVLYNDRVSKSNPKLKESYLTWQKLFSTVNRSMEPSAYERNR